MKSLKDYIYNYNIKEEKDTTKEDEPIVPRKDIMFEIWDRPGHKAKWLKDNFSYNKIEYKYYNKDKGIECDFLLGFQSGTWKLWCGKIGICSYEDNAYCDLKCIKFQDAIMKAIDKIEDILKDIIDDPDNNVMYYVHF